MLSSEMEGGVNIVVKTETMSTTSSEGAIGVRDGLLTICYYYAQDVIPSKQKVFTRTHSLQ